MPSPSSRRARDAAAEGPVRFEERLGVGGDVPADDGRDVTPPGSAGRRERRPHVFAREVHPPGEDALAIEHGELAMAAQVGPAANRRMTERHERAHLGAGRAEDLRRVALRTRGADRVQDHANANPLLRAVFQRVHDRTTRRVVTEDEHRQIDRAFGAANELEDARIRRLAGGEELERIATPRRGHAAAPQHARDGRQNRRSFVVPRTRRRIGGRSFCPPRKFAAAEEKVERDRHERREGEPQQPRQRALRRPRRREQPDPHDHRGQDREDGDSVRYEIPLHR